MAPVVWGLDLKEVHWSKFKSSNMWNSEYHLRKTKFVVYQLVTVFTVASESLATAVLTNYMASQEYVAQLDETVYVYNNDYIGAASYNIFAAVFVSLLFGAAFFSDLFWPERQESRGVRIAWKVGGALSVILYLADVLSLTVITATHCGYFSGPAGVNDGYGDSLLSQFTHEGGTPLCYRQNSRAIAAVVLGWVGWLTVLGSCILLFKSINHIEKGLGPKSTHARVRDAENPSLDSLAKTAVTKEIPRTPSF